MTQKIIALDRDHLNTLISQTIELCGPTADFNHIDVSNVEDFSFLFSDMFSQFNGDISKWNVSNATDMYSMFRDSSFDGDISDWNVGSVTDMGSMFTNSRFHGDLSRWDVSNVKAMENMFRKSEFNGDLSHWDVRKVTTMHSMFEGCLFEQCLAQWDVSAATAVGGMFDDNPAGLAAQVMSAWMLRLFLENRLVPEEPYWAKLFEKMLPMSQSLDLGIEEQTRILWSMHTGIDCNNAATLQLPKLEEPT